jgi:hypothetical protein
VDLPRVACATAAASLFFALALIRGLRIERARQLRHAALARLGARSAPTAPRQIVRLAWLTALVLVSVGVGVLYWQAWGGLHG